MCVFEITRDHDASFEMTEGQVIASTATLPRQPLQMGIIDTPTVFQ
jgi:hypothetical protein